MVSSFAHTTRTLCRVPPENQCYFSTVFLEGCQPWGGDLASICGVWNFFRILTICNHVFVFKLWDLPQEFLSLSFILFTNPSLTYFNLLNSVYYSFVPNGTGHQILEIRVVSIKTLELEWLKVWSLTCLGLLILSFPFFFLNSWHNQILLCHNQALYAL